MLTRAREIAASLLEVSPDGETIQFETGLKAGDRFVSLDGRSIGRRDAVAGKEARQVGRDGSPVGGCASSASTGIDGHHGRPRKGEAWRWCKTKRGPLGR